MSAQAVVLRGSVGPLLTLMMVLALVFELVLCAVTCNCALSSKTIAAVVHLVSFILKGERSVTECNNTYGAESGLWRATTYCTSSLVPLATGATEVVGMTFAAINIGHDVAIRTMTQYA